MASIRTTAHTYPAEEIHAMMQFYNGKICAVTGHPLAQWAHLLDSDAALVGSNPRLVWMFQRNLRQDRHPSHAAEIRENLIPLSPNAHGQIDNNPPMATLFLHEDILARTLTYERELQQWRRAEMRAGRLDPGRPAYEDVFEVFGITQHRWHCTDLSSRPGVWYQPDDCPGVYPSSANPFPIIDTLLSVPFSLLHTLPRLIALMPKSGYVEELIDMGNKITSLWSWDPSPEEVAALTAICAANGNVNGARTPRPLPINHSSRQATTFMTMRSPTTFSAITASHDMAPNNTDHGTFALDSGQVLFGQSPSISWDAGDGLQLTVGNRETLEMMECGSHKGESIIVDVTDSSVSASEGSDVSSDGQDVEEKHDTQLCCSSDVDAWLNMVINDENPLPSLIPTPFLKGSIGSMTVNDILMVKGLIDPGVYVQYLHLESFSL